MKFIDEKISHALSIVKAALELMSRVPIRDPTDHSPFTAMRVGGKSRRRVVVRRRYRRRRLRVRRRRRRDGAWVHNMGHRLAYSAANRRSARRELERSPAAGAVHEHRRRVGIVHRRNSKAIKQIQNWVIEKNNNSQNARRRRRDSDLQIRWIELRNLR